MRVATIPGSARSHFLGFPGAATGKGPPCCSPPSLPCGWMLAILGTSETQEALGEMRLGHVCFLFLVIPELPLDLGCALSTLVCSSSNNDDDNNQMMVMILIIIILIVIIKQVSYIELRVFTIVKGLCSSAPSSQPFCFVLFFRFKKQDEGNPYMYFSSINPLRANINRQILLSDLYTFSDSISLENLLEGQSKFHLVTILLS